MKYKKNVHIIIHIFTHSFCVLNLTFKIFPNMPVPHNKLIRPALSILHNMNISLVSRKKGINYIQKSIKKINFIIYGEINTHRGIHQLKCAAFGAILLQCSHQLFLYFNFSQKHHTVEQFFECLHLCSLAPPCIN
jgi:hypothetical protein